VRHDAQQRAETPTFALLPAPYGRRSTSGSRGFGALLGVVAHGGFQLALTVAFRSPCWAKFLKVVQEPAGADTLEPAGSARYPPTWKPRAVLEQIARTQTASRNGSSAGWMPCQQTSGRFRWLLGVMLGGFGRCLGIRAVLGSGARVPLAVTLDRHIWRNL